MNTLRPAWISSAVMLALTACPTHFDPSDAGGIDPTDAETPAPTTGTSTDAITTDVSGAESSSSDGRGETGDDPIGSCAGICGESARHGDRWCYCVPQCAFADDCCPDYAEACPGTGDEGGCSSNADCGANEVCSNGSGTCILAYDHVYEVYVTEWGDNTDICWDSIPGDCLADVYFRMYFGGELICSSSVVEDASWASWNEPCAIAFNETDPWSLIFRDYDALSPDDPVGVHAFAQPDGSPGPVPVEFLHAGGAIWGDPTTAFTVTVTFVPK